MIRNKDQKGTVKLTLKSHEGKAIVRSCKKEEGKRSPEWFTVGDRNNAVEVEIDKHKDGIYIRMDHRADNMPLNCYKGQFLDGDEVIVIR